MASIADLKKDFERLITANRLGHGYLLFGEAPEEQAQFARLLAGRLEGGIWEESNRLLLDARILVSQEGQIGIDEVREAQQFLWQRPVRSARRTLVVVRGEELTLQAQHAMLKLSEEPPPAGLLLMTVRGPAALMSTLASRFQKIYVRRTGGISRDKEGEALVAAVMAAAPRERSALLKEIGEDPRRTEQFMRALLVSLREDPVRNVTALRAILRRNTAMHTYRTNRKLQLEAVVEALKTR